MAPILSISEDNGKKSGIVAGGGGSLAKELDETSDGGKRPGHNEDNEDAPFPALAGGNSSSSSSSEGAHAPNTAGKKGRGNKAGAEAK